MQVEIWSDVFCPFCYIGKRNFELALEQFPHRDQVTITWKSFQLQPDAPVESDLTNHERLAAKYGIPVEQARQMQASIGQRATEVGLVFDLDNAKVTNSFDAHRLTHLAKEHGLQDAAEERIFKAYFTETRHVGRRETLLELGKEIGLPEAEITAVLDSDRYADDVLADVQEGVELGLQGVPFFVFDRRYAVPGALPPEVFTEVLERAWSESEPVQLVAVAAPADGCDDGSCAVPGVGDSSSS